MTFHQKMICYVALIVLLILASSESASAQGCPTITIQTPASVSMPGESFVVSAIVKNAVGLGDYKYSWTISAGVIEKGQGSASLTVLTGREHAGTNISVTVAVAGFSSYCANTATEQVGVAAIIGCYRPLDEFGADGVNEVRARLDNIYITLNNNPGFRIMFEMEFAEDETTRDRTLRINRILDAIRLGKYDPSKVTFVISSEKERKSTKVWATLEKSYMSEWANRGILINGQDMKQELSTLFQ